jgi:hypothetical protein
MTYALLDMEAHRLVAVDLTAEQLPVLTTALEPHVVVADVPAAHRIIEAWAQTPAVEVDLTEAVRSRL